jgi:hypothetical protein
LLHRGMRLCAVRRGMCGIMELGLDGVTTRQAVHALSSTV